MKSPCLANYPLGKKIQTTKTVGIKHCSKLNPRLRLSNNPVMDKVFR